MRDKPLCLLGAGSSDPDSTIQKTDFIGCFHGYFTLSMTDFYGGKGNNQIIICRTLKRKATSEKRPCFLPINSGHDLSQSCTAAMFSCPNTSIHSLRHKGDLPTKTAIAEVRLYNIWRKIILDICPRSNYLFQQATSRLRASRIMSKKNRVARIYEDTLFSICQSFKHHSNEFFYFSSVLNILLVSSKQSL